MDGRMRCRRLSPLPMYTPLSMPVVKSCEMLCCCAAADGEDGEQMHEPLLPGLGGEDDDGSVGSEDTTDDDSEADEAARLVDDALAGACQPSKACIFVRTVLGALIILHT